MIVPYNATSVSFTGVDPNLMYQIIASYITYSQEDGSEITGPDSNPVTPVNVVSSSTSSMQTLLSTTSVTSSSTVTPTLFEETKNSNLYTALKLFVLFFFVCRPLYNWSSHWWDIGNIYHRDYHSTSWYSYVSNK